jgi:protein TonB
MRISLVILGTAILAGAVAVGAWKWRDLRPAPAPSQEMAMAREMVGQWRPTDLTCADAVTITFHSGNLTVNYGRQSENDVQAVSGVEPNGFIRTYSARLGSRFYSVEGDTLIVHSADGQTTELERCEDAAPAVTPAAASAQDTALAPPPLEASGAPTGADVAQSPAPPPPPARATTTVTESAALDESPSPALTLLSATPAPAPEPIPAPPPPPITRPVWLARPTAAEIAIFYPERALVRELPGTARLDCVVRHDGRLACAVEAESPAGYGFGEAALGIAQSFLMAPTLADGSATEGRRVSVPIVFAQN